MGSLRWPWFRFFVSAHEDEKVAALSDGEFRLWTRVLALARQNEQRPGWVWLVEGEGVDPKDLAAGARCKSLKRPEEALGRLAKLQLVRLHEGGVIEVVNWEKHNPPAPPSKTPAARAEQKRKERGRAKDGGRQDVARRQGGDDEATGLDVARQDVEEDVEREDPPKPPLVAVDDRWVSLRAQLDPEQDQELVAERNRLVADVEAQRLVPSEARYRIEAAEDRLFAQWSAIVAAPKRAAGGA